jgi:hypothetical protein
MKSAFALLVCACAASILSPACGTDASMIGQGKRLVVKVTNGNVGTVDSPLPVSVTQATPFTVSIQAQMPDGSIDSSFNGYVNLTVQPGTIQDLSVRNVQLASGVKDGVVLPVIGSFGETHIWATDLGYEPAAPNRMPPPQCADGIDNNHNGLIDYPADPGCYAPVDDTEDLGSYASGVSQAIEFDLPRISLVRGYDPPTSTDGNATAFPQQQISIDTGWRGGQNYAFSTVVIGLTAAGFYVQDLQNDEHPQSGYGGLYAYNFDTPPFMRVCDRVQILSGTSSDFYGFTEVNYPAWQLEYWDPQLRPCLVPEPTQLGTAQANSDDFLWQIEATLARVQTAGTVSVHVAKHFGPGDVQVSNDATACKAVGLTNPCYLPDATHSNCDFDHSGKIDFNDAAESACAAACSGSCSLAPSDTECSEYSQYASQNDFEVIVEDSSDGSHARVSVDAAAAAGFDAESASSDSNKYGTTVRAITGLVSYFSGGCQFTLNVRCADDVTYCPHEGPCLQNYTAPLSSDVACVHPRSLSQINNQ